MMQRAHSPYDDPELWDEYKEVFTAGRRDSHVQQKQSLNGETRPANTADLSIHNGREANHSACEAANGGTARGKPCLPLAKAKVALIKASQQRDSHNTLRYLRMAEWMLARPASWFEPEDWIEIQELASQVRSMIEVVEGRIASPDTRPIVSIFSRL